MNTENGWHGTENGWHDWGCFSECFLKQHSDGGLRCKGTGERKERFKNTQNMYQRLYIAISPYLVGKPTYKLYLYPNGRSFRSLRSDLSERLQLLALSRSYFRSASTRREFLTFSMKIVPSGDIS